MSRKHTPAITLVVNGTPIKLERCERGYYIGEILIGGVYFHVEAIQALQKETSNGEFVTEVTNSLFDKRIESWREGNDWCVPRLVLIGGKTYFVNVEVYAQ